MVQPAVLLEVGDAWVAVLEVYLLIEFSADFAEVIAQLEDEEVCHDLLKGFLLRAFETLPSLQFLLDLCVGFCTDLGILCEDLRSLINWKLAILFLENTSQVKLLRDGVVKELVLLGFRVAEDPALDEVTQVLALDVSLCLFEIEYLLLLPSNLEQQLLIILQLRGTPELGRRLLVEAGHGLHPGALDNALHHYLIKIIEHHDHAE